MAERQRRKQVAPEMEMLSPAQVADALGVDEKSIRNWAAEGLIEAQRTTAGRYRLPASVVPQFKQLAKEMPLNMRELRRYFAEHPSPSHRPRVRTLQEDR